MNKRMNKRTSFITAGAVTGVLLAGTAAVGANIGILNAADNGNVGDLNAAVEVTTPTVPTSVEPQVIDVYVEEPAETTPMGTALSTTASEAITQEFAVDDAGTVSVRSTGTGVLLDGVVVAEGWSWTAGQTEQGLEVRFTSADSEYVFYASLAEDGTIVARVDEPMVNVVQVPAGSSPATVPSNTAQSSDRDDDDPGEYDDHDQEDDEDHEDEEDEEHEGGEDDD
jgi:hypothetical protein